MGAVHTSHRKCATTQTSIAVINSGTNRASMPLRSALSMSSQNQHSTRFNHDEDVGREMQAEPRMPAQLSASRAVKLW